MNELCGIYKTNRYFTKEAGYPFQNNLVFFVYFPLHLLLNLQGYNLFLYIPFKVLKNSKPNFTRKLCLQYYFPLCPEISILLSLLGQLAFWHGRSSFHMSASFCVLWLHCCVILNHTFYLQDFHFIHVPNCSWLHITELINPFLATSHTSQCHMSCVSWLPVICFDYLWKTLLYVDVPAAHVTSTLSPLLGRGWNSSGPLSNGTEPAEKWSHVFHIMMMQTLLTLATMETSPV